MPIQKKTNNYTLPTKPELEDAYQALWATLQNKLGPYFSDYGQLIEKGSPLNNQYQQLKSNISQHIPSNEDFRSPQRMSEWAQAAALNAPMGLTLKGAPPTKFSRAHDIAQKNAALPIEQGGLGLPPNNTAMDRAKAMGFDIPTYHGTNADITRFDPNLSGDHVQYMKGIFTADNPELASNYGDRVMPLLQKKGITLEDKRAARKAGKELPIIDSIYDKERGILVTKDPRNIRSRFAPFDPMKKNSANILAGTLIGATTLADLYGKEQEQPSILRSVMEKKLKK